MRRSCNSYFCLFRRAAAGVAIAMMLLACGTALASDHGAPAHAEPHEVADVWDASLGIKDRGVDMGEYHIRAHYPVEARKSTVRFVLYAKVPQDRFQAVSQLVTDRQNKLRDQVITATRMTPLSVFDEPGLESFRRRILMRLKRALPELEIDDVYVSDFQLEVQSL